MNKFNRYQIIATLCIAVFIISFSLCVLSMDRHGYRLSVDRYYHELEDDDYVFSELKKGQLKIYYDILADKVTALAPSDYQLPGYSISAVNVDRLKAVAGFVRATKIIAMISFFGIVYCFLVLARRRLYMPLAYGSAFALLFTSLGALVVLLSKNSLLHGIRDMLLYKKYDYFVEGDIVRQLIPDNFARILFAQYLCIEAVVVGVFVTANYIIRRNGRPHEF